MATRRTFLIGAAATTAGLAGAVGSATAQAQTFELELTQEGFVGRSPPSIEGEANPTLEVEAGQNYAIQWTNSYNPESEGIPARHNLVVTTSDGVVRRGEYVFETGQTRTIQFQAQSGLSEYFCEEHMGEGGEFNVAGGSTATATETSGGDMEGGDGGDMEGGDGGDGGDMEGGDGGDGGDGGEETSGGGPGFGVGAALTALGAGAYGALRRGSDD